MASLSPTPKLQFFDNSGNPLVGGKLYTYLAGTLTPSATFTDSTGTAYNSNPVILDSRGEANIWLGSGVVYKFALQDAGGVPIYTVDNVSPATSSGGGGGGGTASVTVSDTAPSAPTAGNLWWKSDEGQMYIYYTDVNSSQWVVANAYAGGASYLPISGGTMTGAITFAGAQTISGTLLTATSVAISKLNATGTPGATNYLRGDGSWQVLTQPNFQSQLFTASGTWTAPTGVTSVRAAVIAGGGGGFYNATGPTSNFGGTGGAAAGVYTVVPGTTYTVTVGTAGVGVSTGTGGVGSTSSFGSFLSATGGGGATTSVAGTAGVGASGTLTNSYVVNTSQSISGSIPYFKLSGTGTAADTGSSTAKVYSATWGASSASAGAGGSYAAAAPGYGGMGGIVYLEWVG